MPVIATVSEGLAIYRRQLADYKAHLDELTVKFGRKVDADFLLSYGGPYYDRVREWSVKLEGMARILDLDKDEIRALDEEADIPVAP